MKRTAESDMEMEEGERAGRELEREREFLAAILETTQEGVVACDPQGVLMLFNRATREMHGLTEEKLPPEEWACRYDLYMPDGQTKMQMDQIPLLRALRGELVRGAEMVIAPKDLPPRRVVVSGQRLQAKDGRGLGAVVTMHDVTERRRAEDELIRQALHDRLTGLPNRALLLDRLEHALARSRRSGARVAVLFADLDHFKLVNDSLGHQAGDELLVAVADRLRDVTRSSDTAARPARSSDTAARPAGETVARLGGDEFVVLCEGFRSERDAIRIAERLATALEPPFTVEGTGLPMSASVGIVLGDRDSTPHSLLRDADTAMHRAKERGRGRYELFDAKLRDRLLARLQREKELRTAIDDDQLRLFYQPIVSLPDRRIIGAEALVRWQHPEHGLLPPSEFIGLAEESGLIAPLGNWVLGQACRQTAEWERSLGGRRTPRVSVNVSARQLSGPDILGEVRRALEVAGADPARLALEITETTLMDDGRAPVEILERLRALGVSLMLDDFGTGYSSLSYLQRLPLDVLKLDRSFVASLRPTGDERNIAQAVVEMARALRLSLVAEGVETEEQLEVLAELGCELAQGFLFARPMAAAEMTDRLSSQALQIPAAPLDR